MRSNWSVTMRIAGMLAIGLLMATAQATFGAPNPEDLRERVERIVDRYAKPLVNPKGGTPALHQAPGGIVGVYIDGEVFYFPYGRIDDVGNSPTKDTIFGLGSITKTFTTSILGQKAELFNRSVSEGYLPPGYKLQPAEAPVTFEQLATFTGGVPRDPNNCDVKGKLQCDQDLFVAFINGVTPPGGKLPAPNLYSNAGIGFLGQILMYKDGFCCFGAPQANRWFDEHLFSHLGMRHTSHPPKWDSKHPLAEAYAYQGGKYVAIPYAPWVPWGTAGRMFSTAEDMVRFIEANVGVDRIDGKKVPEEILEGMRQAKLPRTSTSTPGLLQAFAWVVFPEEPGKSRIIGKDGGLEGVSAYVAVNPDLQYGVITMLNMANVDAVQPRTLDIMRALLSLANAPPSAQAGCDQVCNQEYALCIAASCTPDSSGTALCVCTVESGYSVGPVGCQERAPVKGKDFTQLTSTFSTALYSSNPFYQGSGTSADCYGKPCVSFDGQLAACECSVNPGSGTYWTEAGSCAAPGANVVYSGASSPFDGGLQDLAALIAKCSGTQAPKPQACSSTGGGVPMP